MMDFRTKSLNNRTRHQVRRYRAIRFESLRARQSIIDNRGKPHCCHITDGVMISSMWRVRRDNPKPNKTLRLRFYARNECLSYGNFLSALAEDATFRGFIRKELRAAPFVAFRWETPPLNATTINQPFECLLHDSPGLDVRADPSEFESYFQPGMEVVSFENLGADALLVVPCPTSKSANYSHIGAFHRSAPPSQQDAFWITVAQAVQARLGSQPLWLSTAGGGVDWLHMRLDKQPKYYRHLPWRDWVQDT